jgi:hypothetical protein
MLWGFIGAAAYSLKVITGYFGERKYKGEHIPYHISRLYRPGISSIYLFYIRNREFFWLVF